MGLAIAGLVLLLLTLVFDGLFDGAVDGFLDSLLPDAGYLTMPAIAGAVSAFGATAWILQNQAGYGALSASAVGGGVAFLGGWVAVKMGRSVSHMATDATPSSHDMVGVEGRVVTPIAAESTGEVLVRLGGQPMKLTASSLDGSAVPVGCQIVVVTVTSPTRVVVQEVSAFWE